MAKTILTISLALAALCGAAFAQDVDGNGFDADGPGRLNRGELLRRELGLTPEQMRQIRVINRDSRPKMREAQENFQAARRELDQAIYADSLDEESLRAKVRAVVEAQAEITRVRATSEVAVRKVLNPSQLEKFRALRQRFAGRQDGPPPGGMQRRRNMRNSGPPRGSDEKPPPPYR